MYKSDNNICDCCYTHKKDVDMSTEHNDCIYNICHACFNKGKNKQISYIHRLTKNELVMCYFCKQFVDINRTITCEKDSCDYITKYTLLYYIDLIIVPIIVCFIVIFVISLFVNNLDKPIQILAIFVDLLQLLHNYLEYDYDSIYEFVKINKELVIYGSILIIITIHQLCNHSYV